MEDHLYNLKNAFYIGNFQECVDEAQKISCSGQDEITKDIFMYRSYILQNKASIVLSDILQTTNVPYMKALRRLAEVRDPAKKEQIIAKVKEEIDDAIKSSDKMTEPNSIILAATLLLDNGHPCEALSAVMYALKLNADILEVFSIAIHALIDMDRVDRAVKCLEMMHGVNEDATLTQLATAWVNICLGKNKLQDAFYIYQGLIEKNCATLYLLLGKSQVLINQGKYEEAEEALKAAQSRDPNNPEVIINLIHVNNYLGYGPAVSKRLYSQLFHDHPDHPYIQELISMECVDVLF